MASHLFLCHGLTSYLLETHPRNTNSSSWVSPFHGTCLLWTLHCTLPEWICCDKHLCHVYYCLSITHHRTRRLNLIFLFHPFLPWEDFPYIGRHVSTWFQQARLANLVQRCLWWLCHRVEWGYLGLVFCLGYTIHHSWRKHCRIDSVQFHASLYWLGAVILGTSGCGFDYILLVSSAREDSWLLFGQLHQVKTNILQSLQSHTL